MMHLINRLPTVDEAAQSVTPPLYESYWWFTGWNFNRPVIATIYIGANIKTGHFVHMQVGDNCPVAGYRKEDMDGLQFELLGPIELPEELRK